MLKVFVLSIILIVLRKVDMILRITAIRHVFVHKRRIVVSSVGLMPKTNVSKLATIIKLSSVLKTVMKSIMVEPKTLKVTGTVELTNALPKNVPSSFKKVAARTHLLISRMMYLMIMLQT